VLFQTAHWVLAWSYYRTAVNIPEVLEAAERGYEPELIKTNTCIFWTGIALVTLTYAAYSVFIFTNISFSVKIAFDFVSSFELVVIGVLLIYSVTFMVRNLSANADGAKADLKAILMHTGAFGLFLLSVIILGVIKILLDLGLVSYITLLIADYAALLFSFVSSCLICVILIVLSKPDTEAIEDEDPIEV
jgi:hypothetical protein